MQIYVLWPRTVYIKLSNFILFSLENDDMESSKRCVQLFSLVWLWKCLDKVKEKLQFNYIEMVVSLILPFIEPPAHQCFRENVWKCLLKKK